MFHAREWSRPPRPPPTPTWPCHRHGDFRYSNAPAGRSARGRDGRRRRQPDRRRAVDPRPRREAASTSSARRCPHCGSSRRNIAVIELDEQAFRRSGAGPQDTEDIINHPRAIDGVRAVVFLKQWEPGRSGSACGRRPRRRPAGRGALRGGGHVNARLQLRGDSPQPRAGRRGRRDPSERVVSRRRSSQWHGLLLVDKRPDDSHDVVTWPPRLGERRSAHGTLDRWRGLLLLCVGQATRLQQFLVRWQKTYHGQIRLGNATRLRPRGRASDPARGSRARPRRAGAARAVSPVRSPDAAALLGQEDRARGCTARPIGQPAVAEPRR